MGTKDETPNAGLNPADHRDLRDRERAQRFVIVDEMRAAFAGVSTDEIESEAARALAEVREEMRAERLASGKS